MRRFSPEYVRTHHFEPRNYAVDDADDVFLCLVHASDSGDDVAADAMADMLDHLGGSERERRLNLLETFGADATAVLSALRELAEAAGLVDEGIHSAIDISDAATLAESQRELILSVDGAGPDDILEAARRARLELQDHPQALDCLLELEDHQMAVDEARDRLVQLLLNHEPCWHKESRELHARMRERLKDHPQY